MTVTLTTHPAALVGLAEDEMHDRPVGSVPGQVVVTLMFELVTPAEASDCTKVETLLLVAMQSEVVLEVQVEDQEAPRTMA